MHATHIFTLQEMEGTLPEEFNLLFFSSHPKLKINNSLPNSSVGRLRELKNARSVSHFVVMWKHYKAGRLYLSPYRHFRLWNSPRPEDNVSRFDRREGDGVICICGKKIFISCWFKKRVLLSSWEENEGNGSTSQQITRTLSCLDLDKLKDRINMFTCSCALWIDKKIIINKKGPLHTTSFTCHFLSRHQSVEPFQRCFPSQRSSVICNSQAPTGFLQQTNNSFHGAGNWNSLVWAHISGCPFPLPEPLNHYQPSPMVTCFPHVTPPAISRALWKSPLLFFCWFCSWIASWNPRTVWSSRSGAQPQCRQRLPQGRKERMEGKRGRVGGQGGRKWRKGSSKQAPFTDSSGDTDAGARFWRNKKSTSDGSGFCLIIPSSVLPCVGSERSCWCVREESGPNWGLTTYARWLLDCIVWWPTKPYTSKKLRCACDCRCFTSPLSYCTSQELI